MQAPFERHSNKTLHTLLLFIFAWVLLNFLQAAFLDVDADEAYYWFYAQHLAWGYFDHPPLVALSIKLGELFGHGSFYTRIGTILFSAGTLYFGYKALPEYVDSLRWYLLLFASAVLLHAYSFIATPDAPLLFFTTLFFYAYKRYLQTDRPAQALLLAVAVTGMFYSKYHGILPVLFTVLSNPKLLLRRSLWVAAVLILLLFSPHLWWQYQHDWPTFRYHLLERGAGTYTLSKTTDYIAGQLFLWGPLTTIPALIYFFRLRYTYNAYERAHVFTLWGVLAFFLLSSFRSIVEPHWTLIAGLSYIVLMIKALHTASPKRKRLFSMLFAGNILLILLARVLMLVPASPVKKIKAFSSFVYARTWAADMHAFAAGKPIVFSDSYRLPAIYQYYYPGVKTWGYNTLNYRKSQYDILPDAFLNNQAVYLAAPDSLNRTTYFFKSSYKPLFIQGLDSFKALNRLKLKWVQPIRNMKAGEKFEARILLSNNGTDTVITTGLVMQYAFYKNRYEQLPTQVHWPFTEQAIPPGTVKAFSLTIVVPAVKGRTNLLFSIVQPPLAGNFASQFYKVTLERN